MKTVNRVLLVGNLGAKPELRQSKAGRPYTLLRLATKRYRGPGEEDATDWHSIFVFGVEAERCATWLDRGALLLIEGTLSYWKIETLEEDRKYRNAIHADHVGFLSYGRSTESARNLEHLDNPAPPRNHDAVAHL